MKMKISSKAIVAITKNNAFAKGELVIDYENRFTRVFGLFATN